MRFRQPADQCTGTIARTNTRYLRKASAVFPHPSQRELPRARGAKFVARAREEFHLCRVFKFRETPRTLSHSPGIPLSLPGVEFAGELPPSDAAVWRLLFLALDQDEVRGYWGGDECCEGCVSNSQSPIRSIESLIRLTRSSLSRDASRVSLVSWYPRSTIASKQDN